MNKYGLIIILLVFGSASENVHAQRLKEWFNQKETQREYLMQQIAALRVYVDYAQKGYEIYDKGLTTVGNFKNSEFNLQNDFFSSLKNVNPEVARYARVADIINMQIEVVRRSNYTMRSARDGGFIRTEELEYITRVHGRLLDDCAHLLDELITLTTSGKLEMEDDERLQRIDKLYTEMQGNYKFSQQFSKETLQLSDARKHDQRDIEKVKKISNLNK